MTWDEFNADVRTFLSVHNRRQGVQALIDRWIVAGVVDIQRFVEYFQQRHLNLLAPSDLLVNGYASKGDMPDGQATRFRILKTDIEGNILSCAGGFLPSLPWTEAQRAVCGASPRGTLGVSIHRAAHYFYLVPSLDSDELLEISWKGVKSSFGPDDLVLFDGLCAQAVGEYVLARLSRLVDKDLQMAQSFDASYKALRRAVYTEYHHRKFLADYDASDVGIYAGTLRSGVVTGFGGDSFEPVNPRLRPLIPANSPITTEDGSVVTTEDGSPVVTG